MLLASLASFDTVAQNGQEQTSAPEIRVRFLPDDYGLESMGYYDWCSVEFVNTDEEDITIRYSYRYIDEWDGTEFFQDWIDFMPEWNAVVLQESAWVWVEGYAMAEGKLPSDTVRRSFHFNRYPSQHYQRYYDFIVDGIYYRIIGESTVAITKHTLDMTIDFNAFTGAITSSDPDWYMEEGGGMFASNPCYFEDVNIPATVEYKGKTYTVAAVYDYAFESCGLTSLQLPGTVTKIGKCAFWYASVPGLTVPDNVACIGEGAFAHCYDLTDVTIPASCDTIGDAAFFGCENLASVQLSEGVKWIGAEAFNRCTALTEFEIPASVEWIGSCAFEGCMGLTSIICHGTVPPEADWPFVTNEDGYSMYIYENATLFVPDESLDAYRDHPEWCWFYRIVPFLGAGPGDINGDGTLNVGDATGIINLLLNAGEECPAYCDVNGDGTVNIADITVLINMLLNATE